MSAVIAVCGGGGRGSGSTMYSSGKKKIFVPLPCRGVQLVHRNRPVAAL